MNNNWKRLKISDFAEIIMGQSPESKYYNNNGIGVPFLQGNRTFGGLYPTIDTWCTNPIKLARKNSVLMSVRAPVGDTNIADQEICIGRGLSSLSMKKGNNKFLFYLIKANKSKILANEAGTVFGAINKNVLSNIYLSITTNIDEQNTISSFLCNLDSKIEINLNISKNLEELAQTLYKRWFVDFEFPNEKGEPYKSSGGEMVNSELGLIPKGWEVRNVSDLFVFIGGSQPPKEEHKYDYRPGYVRFIQNRDFKEDPKHITFIKDSKKNKMANKLDILIDKYGEVGQIRFGIEGAYNVALAKLEPHLKSDLELLRGYFSQREIREYLSNSSIASTRGSLNSTTFTGLKIAYPSKLLIKHFSEFNQYLLLSILNKKSENKKLAELRDLLLPKLMSGEIEVPLEE
jgi:type I restriction enzyme S subunit